MKTILLKLVRDIASLRKLTKRPALNLERILPKVRTILSAVRKQGDKAVMNYTKKFDYGDSPQTRGLSPNFLVSKTEWDKAKVGPAIRQALKQAAKNIEKFHCQQVLKEKPVETTKGIRCWREWRPIERVGLYIPKGLVSTVLMLGIPAKIAGCSEVIMCTPPDSEGRIAPEMLLAAKIARISKIFKIGGAQAIAAMAYGTETVPKVDKIFGPGNQWVMAAKMLVSIDPEAAAIDLPAGPSEVLVIADKTAKPLFVTADLLSQAEHGADSQVVLLTDNADSVKKTKQELKKQLLKLPPQRRRLAESTLKNSLAVLVNSLDKAVDFANFYAPEHLILNLKNPEKYIGKIKNAGSVFVGEYSPESAGDYASGTNHVLPTSGYARSYGGVSVDSFVKKITFQKLTKAGLKSIAQTVKTLADTEQMPGHKNAITARVNV